MPDSNVPVWRFLGNIELGGPNGDLAAPLGKKPIALLAYLAMAGDRVRRDEVAAMLWPGPDPSRSKHNLRQSLLTIRRAFGDWTDSVISVSDTWLELTADAVKIDVRRLAEIDARGGATSEELLDLCRGPFLRGLLTRAQPFDDWSAAQRNLLADIAARALDKARIAAERSGNAEVAAGLRTALVDCGAPPPAGPAPPPAAMPSNRPSPRLKRVKRRRRLRAAILFLVGAACSAAAIVGVYYGCESCRDRIDTVLSIGLETPRISVRPFTTAHGTIEETALAGGVTLGVTYALYAITDRELFVVTPPPVAQEMEQRERIALAKRLGVRYLISGAVSIIDDEVRVNVQCLDAELGIVVWHDRFSQPYTEAFKLQDDISRRIVSGLGIELSRAEWNRIQFLDDTTDLKAWLNAADGVRHLIRVTMEDVAKARESYERALRHDPNYVSARRGLAWVSFLNVRLGWSSNPAAAISEAENQLAVVLRKRPDDGTSLSLKGAILLLKEDYRSAIKAGRRATEKLPGSADAWAVLAHTLTYVGEYEEALECIERARSLSAIEPAWYYWTQGRALRMAGQISESVRVLETSMRSGEPTIVLMVELTASYAAAGRMAKATALARRIRTAVPGFSATEWLSHPRIEDPEVQSREFEYLSSAGL